MVPPPTRVAAAVVVAVVSIQCCMTPPRLDRIYHPRMERVIPSIYEGSGNGRNR